MHTRQRKLREVGDLIIARRRHFTKNKCAANYKPRNPSIHNMTLLSSARLHSTPPIATTARFRTAGLLGAILEVTTISPERDSGQGAHQLLEGRIESFTANKKLAITIPAIMMAMLSIIAFK